MKYSVYTQRLTESLGKHFASAELHQEYFFLDWILDSTVDGTKELYEQYHNQLLLWTDSFENILPAEIPFDDFEFFKPYYLMRALVTDEDGRILNFHDLTDCYIQQINKHKGSSGLNFDIPKQSKVAFTRPETEEFLSQYHMRVPDIRVSHSYAPYLVSTTHIVKSWKTKTRKQRQYGKHSEKLSHVLFEMECEHDDDVEMEM